jgi:hypothetical protein
MNLPDTIYAHVQVLPENLQRETLDFVEYLERRYGLPGGAAPGQTTEQFLARFAGCLGADFPADIDDSGWGQDVPREEWP